MLTLRKGMLKNKRETQEIFNENLKYKSLKIFIFIFKVHASIWVYITVLVWGRNVTKWMPHATTFWERE